MMNNTNNSTKNRWWKPSTPRGRYLVGVLGTAMLIYPFMLDPPSRPLMLLSVLISLGICVFLTIQWVFIKTRRPWVGILAVLRQAMELGHPLPQWLRVSAAQESRNTARKFNQLAQQLEDGLSISQALELPALQMPRQWITRVAAAEALGQLPSLLAVIETEAQRERKNYQLRYYRNYLIAGLFLSLPALLITYFAIFLVPKLRVILIDFQFQPHDAMGRFFIFCISEQFLEKVIPNTVLISICAFIMIQLTRGLGRFCRWSRFLRNSPLENLWPYLTSNLPWYGKLYEQRSLAWSSRVLAQSLLSGRPLVEALPAASRGLESWSVARGLEDLHRRLAGGQTIETALNQCAIAPFWRQILAGAAKTQALPAALEFLATYYQSRAERKEAFSQALFFPMLTIVTGLGVALIGLTVFYPISELLHSVNASPLFPF